MTIFILKIAYPKFLAICNNFNLCFLNFLSFDCKWVVCGLFLNLYKLCIKLKKEFSLWYVSQFVVFWWIIFMYHLKCLHRQVYLYFINDFWDVVYSIFRKVPQLKWARRTLLGTVLGLRFVAQIIILSYLEKTNKKQSKLKFSNYNFFPIVVT